MQVPIINIHESVQTLEVCCEQLITHGYNKNSHMSNFLGLKCPAIDGGQKDWVTWYCLLDCYQLLDKSYISGYDLDEVPTAEEIKQTVISETLNILDDIVKLLFRNGKTQQSKIRKMLKLEKKFVKKPNEKTKGQQDRLTSGLLHHLYSKGIVAKSKIGKHAYWELIKHDLMSHDDLVESVSTVSPHASPTKQTPSPKNNSKKKKSIVADVEKTPGYLYVVGAGPGRFKCGKTRNDVRKLCKRYQTVYGNDIVYRMYRVNDYHAAEKHLLGLLTDYRLDGSEVVEAPFDVVAACYDETVDIYGYEIRDYDEISKLDAGIRDLKL